MVSAYQQSCPCRGRGLAALRDFERYDRQVREISLSIMALNAELVDRRDPTLRTEITRLEMDRIMARRGGERAYERFMVTPTACQMCEGRGFRLSLGQVGSWKSQTGSEG